METFTYSPLTKLTSMRLLKILEHEERSPLRCELFEVDLDTQEIPRYTALSYCWGDQTDRRDIICNGKRLTITATLELALRMTRNHDPNEAIWADQICICQPDMQEKVQQLRVMTVIFQAAWTVIGWLGPEDPTTSLGIEQVEKIGHTFDYETNKDEMAASGYTVDPSLDLSTSAELYDSLKTDPITWLAFSRFFDRPWFSRVWIVQEMLPPLQRAGMTRTIDAILLCGSHSVDWPTVFYAARWAHRAWYMGHHRPSPPDTAIDGVLYTNRLSIHAFSHVAYLIDTTRGIGHYTFETLELLRSFRDRLATDPRDKIFALLGLSNFNTSPETTGPADRSDLIAIPKVPVDYSRTVLETYRTFARAYIDDAVAGGPDRWLPPDHPGHALEILHHTAPRCLEPGWPSWVPDWRREGCHGHMYFPVTHPSKARSATVGAVVYPHPDPNCLKVAGVLLGRVAWAHAGNHASQVTTKDPDPRAVGKMIAAQIGAKYKYGSRKRNLNPDTYREKKEDDSAEKKSEADVLLSENVTPEDAGMMPLDDEDVAIINAIYGVEDELSDQELNTEVATNVDTKIDNEPTLDVGIESNIVVEIESNTDVAPDLDTVIGNEADEPEDTETAFLWTLTLNQLPRIFAAAGFTPDEYARTQVLYDCMDIFRSQIDRTPMPPFTESQIQNNARMAVGWKIESSGGELEKFFKACLCDRRLFFTDTGYIGIAHDDVQVGDDAAILFGMGTACVLRPVLTDGGEHAHELIGNAWIRGASHGEVVEEMYRNGEIQPGQPVGQPITLT